MMPLGPARRDDVPREEGETAEVVRHFENALNRALDFLGYTIDDVVNSRTKKEHVKRAVLLSKRIDRDLAAEPWRGEASARLGAALARKMGFSED